jgi:hypothetical protein
LDRQLDDRHRDELPATVASIKVDAVGNCQIFKLADSIDGVHTGDTVAPKSDLDLSKALKGCRS